MISCSVVSYIWQLKVLIMTKAWHTRFSSLFSIVTSDTLFFTFHEFLGFVQWSFWVIRFGNRMGLPTAPFARSIVLLHSCLNQVEFQEATNWCSQTVLWSIDLPLSRRGGLHDYEHGQYRLDSSELGINVIDAFGDDMSNQKVNNYEKVHILTVYSHFAFDSFIY